MKSETGQKQRDIQKQVGRGRQEGKTEGSGAMQAGARRYPERHFRRCIRTSRAQRADLPVAPMYDAPFYKGSDKLKDKVAADTGGDSGIGRSVAVLFARGRADVPSCISTNLKTQTTQRLLLKGKDESAL